MSTWTVLKDLMKKIVDRKCFYSSTKDRRTDDDGKKPDGHISFKDYLTCENILDVFGMENMGDYHDHYLKRDVLLLVDVFGKFIDTCMKFYGLDPCHYLSSPGLSWDAMLKMTEIELKKTSDINMHLFNEKGLRGGICYIAKSYAKANKKYMNVYDSNKSSKFITYLDMNNLHGWGRVVIFLMAGLSG